MHCETLLLHCCFPRPLQSMTPKHPLPVRRDFELDAKISLCLCQNLPFDFQHLKPVLKLDGSWSFHKQPHHSDFEGCHADLFLRTMASVQSCHDLESPYMTAKYLQILHLQKTLCVIRKFCAGLIFEAKYPPHVLHKNTRKTTLEGATGGCHGNTKTFKVKTMDLCATDGPFDLFHIL